MAQTKRHGKGGPTSTTLRTRNDENGREGGLSRGGAAGHGGFCLVTTAHMDHDRQNMKKSYREKAAEKTV
jgi:hypothetical protein